MIKIPAEKRFPVFLISVLGMTILPAFIPFFSPHIPILCLLGFLAGFMRSFLYIIFNNVIQLNVAKDKRGRIFGLMGIILHTTVPLGMIIGGVLAEFLPLAWLIPGCFIISGLSAVPFIFYPPTKKIFLTERRHQL